MPPIPPIRDNQVEAVADWMQTHRENRRPLSVSAPLLTLVCALHEKGYALPNRRRLAAAIGCTKEGVEAAISTSIAYGEITERHVTLEGAVAQHGSTPEGRFLDPSPDLLHVCRGRKYTIGRRA